MCELSEHMGLARALGLLFEHLQRPRYAKVCTSEVTMNVLAAWDSDRTHGFKAMAAARAASGVEPPDIPGLMAWGRVMGMEESAVLQSTAFRLERAIEAGEFNPGDRGWRKIAERITTLHLSTASPSDPDGRTPLERVHSERLESWAHSRGPIRGRLAGALAPDLISPAPIPEDAEVCLAPVRWLLGLAEEGVPLTQTNVMARSVVAEGCQRFDWLTLTGRPRSELDLPEAWTLRTLLLDRGRCLEAARR